MDKNVLSGAPAFEREHWPDMSDAEWRSSIHRYYGYPEQAAVRDRTVLVHRDERPVRKELSATAAVFLVLLLAGALALTYLVSTRGWEQAKVDIGNSVSGVSYAMKDTSDDVALTAKVKTSLSLNKRVPTGAINVDSNDGVVTLRGDVPNEETRLLVEGIAKDTPGVQQVRNHLYVVTAGAPPAGR
jgi:osmotically-inducible protein OsmY